MSPHRALRLSRPLSILVLLTAGLVATGVSASGASAPTTTPVARTTTSPTPTTTPPSVPSPSSPTAGPPTVDISPMPPTAPTGLRTTAVTTNSVTLAWNASAGGCCGVSSYTVNYNQAFNDIFWSQQVGNVTTVTITTGITAAREYRFHVVARDSVGHTSASSNSITVVTPASDTAADQTPPTAPTNLTAGATGPTGTPLTWTGSTDNVGVVAYDVFHFDGLFVSTRVATTTGTTATVQPIAGRPNMFYVRARDAAGNLSASSNFVSLTTTSTTTPPPPPTCTLSYRTTSQWGGGFVAEATITNTGPAPVNGWTATLAYGGDQHVTNTWNATFTQTGSTVTLTNATWNNRIAVGGSVTAGLMGRWASSAAAPTAATLNGAPCTLG